MEFFVSDFSGSCYPLGWWGPVAWVVVVVGWVESTTLQGTEAPEYLLSLVLKILLSLSLPLKLITVFLLLEDVSHSRAIPPDLLKAERNFDLSLLLCLSCDSSQGREAEMGLHAF